MNNKQPPASFIPSLQVELIPRPDDNRRRRANFNRKNLRIVESDSPQVPQGFSQLQLYGQEFVHTDDIGVEVEGQASTEQSCGSRDLLKRVFSSRPPIRHD